MSHVCPMVCVCVSCSLVILVVLCVCVPLSKICVHVCNGPALTDTEPLDTHQQTSWSVLTGTPFCVCVCACSITRCLVRRDWTDQRRSAGRSHLPVSETTASMGVDQVTTFPSHSRLWVRPYGHSHQLVRCSKPPYGRGSVEPQIFARLEWT